MSLDCYECGTKISFWRALKRWINSKAEYNESTYTAKDYYTQDFINRHNDMLGRIKDLTTTQRDIIQAFNQLGTSVNTMREVILRMENRPNSPNKR